MPLNLAVPSDIEDILPADFRENWEVIDSMISGLAEGPAGLEGRPVVVNGDGSGLTQGELGAGNGPDMNLDGGEFRGAVLATDDAAITADGAVVLAHSTTVQRVNKATSVTLTIADADFPLGASATYVQMGAGKIIFSPTAPLTLGNFSGHNKSGGQYAVVTITRLPDNLILLTGLTGA